MHSIRANCLIMECELLVLSESDTAAVNCTDLQFYTFKYNDTQDCLVLGHGEIFNHDSSPNVGYKLAEIDGRKVMQFYALTDIEPYSQLFIDYSADTKVDTTAYRVNLV